MHNSLLGSSTPKRPNTAGNVAGTRSNERFAGLRQSLAQLSDTVHQRTGPGNSASDMQMALHGSAQPGASPPRADGESSRAAGHSGASSALRQLAVSRQGAGPASQPEVAWREVKENSARLQQHIALEVRRRAEGQKALQQLVDARAKELAQQIERKVQERMLALHKNVDSLTQRVEVLNRELAVEREKNVRLTQELKFQASQGLTEVKSSLERERTQRTEKEGLLSRKLSEDVFRLQERIDVERHARDTMLATVREEIGRVAKQRHKSDEQLVQQLLADAKALKEQLAAERSERERGEEQLAAALSEVVAQVKHSIASVA